MDGPRPFTRPLPLHDIDLVVLAGGGNRCWWQAGLLEAWLERGWALPARLAGTSAGAGVAASFLSAGPRVALEACARLYRENPRIVHRDGRFGIRFAHEWIYPAWIASFVHAGTFERVRAHSTQLVVAVTRPSRWLGIGPSVTMATLAYLVDKFLFHSIHPRLPRWFGLTNDFRVLNDCATLEQSQSLLIAAGAAPPLIGARLVDDRAALDGGYTDNAPVPPRDAGEHGRTLVLLSRHYPRLPPVFRMGGRFYLQASARIPVSTLDCTGRASVAAAYELGLADGRRTALALSPRLPARPSTR